MEKLIDSMQRAVALEDMSGGDSHPVFEGMKAVLMDLHGETLTWPKRAVYEVVASAYGWDVDGCGGAGPAPD